MKKIDIGILLAEQIKLDFIGDFSCGGTRVSGAQCVSVEGASLRWNDIVAATFHFVPLSADCRVTVHDVVIGIGFHWQRCENQTFGGEFIFTVEQGMVRVVNRLPVEDYLVSVISSEMSATASLEFLKAHTVISRSWLYAQLERKNSPACGCLGEETADETIRWYSRENHTGFDLCADDHCQRYQGLTRAINPNVHRAVLDTRDIVLMHHGRVCDARFSKCCGGMTERFSACWEERNMDYLQAFRDNADKSGFIDLTREDAARRWIETVPEAFCATDDKKILSQIMNGYDCETNDFYRWTVRYSRSELSRLVARRSGYDFGTIVDLQPVERAASGRLVRLRIVGTKMSRIVGKELEIRRWLSESHLYSSAFVVDKEPSADGTVFFVLKGAGWGHGVGLCQIGAAVMGEQGYDYREILSHYYPGASLENIRSASVGEP